MGGLLGAILAVPLTATLKVLLKRYVWQRSFLNIAPNQLTEETFALQQAMEGTGAAVMLAREFVGDDACVLAFPDDIHLGEVPLARQLAEVYERTGDAVLALEERPEGEDISRYGVAEVEGSKVIRIVEKPKKPKSDLAVVGIYFYDAQVFDIIRTLKPSARGELEITDVNNHYLRAGTLHCDRLQGWWTDAGTFESLAAANELVRAK